MLYLKHGLTSYRFALPLERSRSRLFAMSYIRYGLSYDYFSKPLRRSRSRLLASLYSIRGPFNKIFVKHSSRLNVRSPVRWLIATQSIYCCLSPSANDYVYPMAVVKTP
jgi:hypothetical protein